MNFVDGFICATPLLSTDVPCLAPRLCAGHEVGDIHGPISRLLPKLHSMPPAAHCAGNMPADAPFKKGCHGTSWKTMPSSIMAKRPLASWVEPTSVPLTYSPVFAAVNFSPRSAAM